MNLRQFAGFTAVCATLPLLAVVSSPARAQGVYPTPTPLPHVVATQNAAESRSSAAQAQIKQANADKARADEMLRNGEAQYQQAQSDINAAREAAATQNAVLVGELIGNFESDSRQMRDTNIGQAGIISAQQATIISLTNRWQAVENENQALRVDKQTASAVYAATVKRADEAQANAAPSPLVWLVVIGFMGLLAVLLIVVLGRKSGAAQVVYSGASPLDYGGEGEVVGENVVDN